MHCGKGFSEEALGRAPLTPRCPPPPLARACALGAHAGPALPRHPRLEEEACAAAVSSILCLEFVVVVVSVAFAFPAVALRILHRGRRPCGKVSRGVRAYAAPPCAPRTALGVAVLGRLPLSRRRLPLPGGSSLRSAPPSPRLRTCPVAGTVPPPGRPERGRNQGPRRQRQRPRLRWRRRPGRARSARNGVAGARPPRRSLSETRFRGRFSVSGAQAGPAGRCGRCGGQLRESPKAKAGLGEEN